jgi:hypothetical protein
MSVNTVALTEGEQAKSGRWTLYVTHNPNTGNLVVEVENPSHTYRDFPIMYSHSGKVAYDYPERIPETVKNDVQRLFERLWSARVA